MAEQSRVAWHSLALVALRKHFQCPQRELQFPDQREDWSA